MTPTRRVVQHARLHHGPVRAAGLHPHDERVTGVRLREISRVRRGAGRPLRELACGGPVEVVDARRNRAVRIQRGAQGAADHRDGELRGLTQERLLMRSREHRPLPRVVLDVQRRPLPVGLGAENVRPGPQAADQSRHAGAVGGERRRHVPAVQRHPHRLVRVRDHDMDERVAAGHHVRAAGQDLQLDVAGRHGRNHRDHERGRDQRRDDANWSVHGVLQGSVGDNNLVAVRDVNHVLVRTQFPSTTLSRDRSGPFPARRSGCPACR